MDMYNHSGTKNHTKFLRFTDSFINVWNQQEELLERFNQDFYDYMKPNKLP